MDVAGWQVNNSFIMIKHLTKAFGGSCEWNEEWQTRITYEYQLSTVYLMDFAEFKRMVTAPNSDFPLPSFLLCLVKMVRPGALKKMKALFDDPNTIEKLVDLGEFCKEFAAAMGSKPYFHGDEPGQRGHLLLRRERSLRLCQERLHPESARCCRPYAMDGAHEAARAARQHLLQGVRPLGVRRPQDLVRRARKGC